MIQIDINMPIGCIYEGDNGKTEYCPLCNHDDVPYCQYLDDDEAALGIDERPCYCPLYKSETQWIPCSERLPEDEQVVLVQDTEGSMWIWKYFSENLKYRSPYQWEDENGEWQLIDEVVAWMPTPEPWKGEEQ